MTVVAKHTFRKGHRISFIHAWEGIRYAVLSQPNFKIHGIFAVLAVSMSVLLHISCSEWVAIILVIFFVFAAEMLNSAIEETVNLITSEWRQEAKQAKDIAAGGVLFAAICSVIIGLLIFIPRLLAFI